MKFLIFIILYAMLFCGSYFAMSWRRHVRQIKYGDFDWDPTLVVSILIPPFGIIYALCDVAIHKLGWYR